MDPKLQALLVKIQQERNAKREALLAMLSSEQRELVKNINFTEIIVCSQDNKKTQVLCSQ